MSTPPVNENNTFPTKEQSLLRSALYSWLGLHLTSLAALLIQRSTHPTVLGRFSSGVAALIVLLTITTPIVWSWARWFPQRAARLRWPVSAFWWIAVALSAAALLGTWAYRLGPTASHLLLRLYVSVVWGTVALWALAHVPLLPTRLTAWLPTLLGLGTSVLLLWLATSFPGLRWTDEGYTANLSWTYYHTGYPRVAMYQPVDVHAMSFMSWGLGAWLEVFGFSLSAARVYVFAVGLLGLAVTLVVACKHYAPTAAWAGVIVAAFGLSGLNTIFRDIEVSLLLALALYAAWRAMDGGPAWWHGVAGFFVAFSVDGHPIAYRFSLAFGAAYLWEWARLLRARRHFVAYKPLGWLVLGGAFGVGAYLSWYTLVLPVLGQYDEMPLFTLNGLGSLDVLAAELREALRSTPILLLLSALGAIAAWRRNTPFDRLLAFALVVPPLVLAMLYSHMRQYYLMHSLTLQALLVASLFQYFADAFSSPQRRATVLNGLLVVVLLANGAFLYERVRHKDAQSYDEVLTIAAEVRELLPPETTIVAPDPFYFGLWDYDFREAATPDKIALRDSISTTEAWEQLAPDAVIVVHGYPIRHLSQSAADYVHTHAYRLVRTWETRRLGTVELYVRTARAKRTKTPCPRLTRPQPHLYTSARGAKCPLLRWAFALVFPPQGATTWHNGCSSSAWPARWARWPAMD